MEKITVRSPREADALVSTFLMGWECKSESRDGSVYQHRWYMPGQTFSPAEVCVTTMNASGAHVGNHIARCLPRFSASLLEAYRAWEETIRAAQDPGEFALTFSLVPFTDEQKKLLKELEDKPKKKAKGIQREVLLTVTRYKTVKGKRFSEDEVEPDGREADWTLTGKPAMTLCLASLRALGYEVEVTGPGLVERVGVLGR